jgi:ribosome recycling factor
MSSEEIQLDAEERMEKSIALLADQFKGVRTGRAIQSSGIGLNPNSDNKVIRINVPSLSVEQRKNLVNRVKELSEEARISIRNIRRDANKQADVEQQDKILTEDENARCKEEIQSLTKRFEGKVNEMADKKSAEILET